MTHVAPLIVHVGYPKTATTTFQKHVFPRHPDIEYLGKFIPSFQYVDEKLRHLIDQVLHRGTLNSCGTDQLRALVQSFREQCQRNCLLISSESFIHPSVIDTGVVAIRIKEAFGPCKILITIREQVSAILSFYWMHGRFGQYLTIGAKDEAEPLEYPIPFSEWLRFQRSAEDRNYLGTLHYDAVVSHYVGIFGAENVCVLLYEALTAEPDAYAHQLGCFLGVDTRQLHSLMSGKHEFQSQTRLRPWNGKKANELLAIQGNQGLRKLLRLLRPQAHQSAIASFEKEIAGLQDHYRAGNARLMRQLSLQLERFGYNV